jgi:hypothetical protein
VHSRRIVAQNGCHRLTNEGGKKNARQGRRKEYRRKGRMKEIRSDIDKWKSCKEEGNRKDG